MEDDHDRPSPLSGLWSCVVGGLLLVLLLIVLDPVLRVEDCPNHGGSFSGSGGASAFADPAWDFFFPLLALGWVVLVVMEQALPVTWRGRSRLEGWVRAGVAVMASMAASCLLALSFAVVCR
ncbi:hypothetical protein [Actinoplanes sp. NPDC049599]|uniref:hypothetical protein n=1 Tax=Actinoplanes sp. NPDC049599 TaxID=3363903 RepID=UPI0037A4DED0